MTDYVGYNQFYAAASKGNPIERSQLSAPKSFKPLHVSRYGTLEGRDQAISLNIANIDKSGLQLSVDQARNPNPMIVETYQPSDGSNDLWLESTQNQNENLHTQLHIRDQSLAQNSRMGNLINQSETAGKMYCTDTNAPLRVVANVVTQVLLSKPSKSFILAKSKSLKNQQSGRGSSRSILYNFLNTKSVLPESIKKPQNDSALQIQRRKSTTPIAAGSSPADHEKTPS